MSYANSNYYKKGQWNFICDVCGFKLKSGDGKKRWDGLMVCEADWEPDHPQKHLRVREDKQTVPWVRATSDDGFFPPANFRGAPLTGYAPLLVNFEDLSNNAPQDWSWDFQNNGSEDSTVMNPSYVYVTTGTYSVSLVVSNINGSATATKTDYITAVVPPVVADFSANHVTGYAPLAVTFTDLSESAVTPPTVAGDGAPMTTWAWKFTDPDGAVDSTVEAPTFTYTQTGTYSVQLQATNGYAQTDTETKIDYIEVIEPPMDADFTANVLSGPSPLTVNFTDLSQVNPTSWAWDFKNDGDALSSLQNPTYTYAIPGVYTVKLTADNGFNSDTRTRTSYITVESTTCTDGPLWFTPDTSAATHLIGMEKGGLAMSPDGIVVQIGRYTPGVVSRIVYSTDFGVTWQNSANGEVSNAGGVPGHVMYNAFNGVFFATVTSNLGMVSEDGENWTQVTVGSEDPPVTFSTPSSSHNIYAANGYFWINNFDSVYRSVNGISWARVANTQTGTWSAATAQVCWSGANYVQTAVNGNSCPGAYSSDGITYEQGTGGVNVLASGIATNGAGTVVIGNAASGSDLIAVSTDHGVTWTNVDVSPLTSTSHQLFDVTYTQGRFIVFTAERDYIFISADGLTWTRATSPTHDFPAQGSANAQGKTSADQAGHYVHNGHLTLGADGLWYGTC